MVWEYGKTPFASEQEYGSGTISSENRVEVRYNDEKVITSLAPRSFDDDRNDEGRDHLNLKDVIQFSDGKPGVYTVNVTNTLRYRTCNIVPELNAYDKETDLIEKKTDIHTRHRSEVKVDNPLPRRGIFSS